MQKLHKRLTHFIRFEKKQIRHILIIIFKDVLGYHCVPLEKNIQVIVLLSFLIMTVLWVIK